MRTPGPLRRFLVDERGVSAVEFAMIAPIMIFFYFGLAEFCQGYMAQKRMSHASAMVADLVSQSSGPITEDGVADVFAIGDLIMSPFSPTPLNVRVSSVTRGSNGVVKVDWSQGHGLTPLNKNAVVTTVPANLIANGESLIISDATYLYNSPVDYLIPTGITFDQTHYLRPRVVEKIECPDC